MMKIAVASDGNQVTEHFGHSQSFWIYHVEEGKVVKSENIPNPGHRPGFLPNFLSDQGINTVISGGMGGGAVEIFKEKGIEVVIGARGNADDAVRSYLQGNLQTSGSICHEHQHSHECEE
jgi:predicted Fe-Mo cluster-binding NifX family protein